MTIKEWEELEPGDVLALREGVTAEDFRNYSITGRPFGNSEEEKRYREGMDIIVDRVEKQGKNLTICGLYKTQSNYFNSWWFLSEWFDIKKKYREGTYPVRHLHFCTGEEQLVKILSRTESRTLVKTSDGKISNYDNIYVNTIRKKAIK